MRQVLQSSHWDFSNTRQSIILAKLYLVEALRHSAFELCFVYRYSLPVPSASSDRLAEFVYLPEHDPCIFQSKFRMQEATRSWFLFRDSKKDEQILFPSFPSRSCY